MTFLQSSFGTICRYIFHKCFYYYFRISNPSGVRFKPWYLNVIKPLRTSCANSKIMKLLDVNSPTSQIKSDPGSNAKWTLLLPSAWACRLVWLCLYNIEKLKIFYIDLTKKYRIFFCCLSYLEGLYVKIFVH